MGHGPMKKLQQLGQEGSKVGSASDEAGLCSRDTQTQTVLAIPEIPFREFWRASPEAICSRAEI